MLMSTIHGPKIDGLSVVMAKKDCHMVVRLSMQLVWHPCHVADANVPPMPCGKHYLDHVSTAGEWAGE